MENHDAPLTCKNKPLSIEWRTLGMALTFLWVFLAFPTTGSGSPLQPGFDGGVQVLLRLLTVGLVPGCVLAAAWKLVQGRRVRLVLLGVMAAVRIAAEVLALCVGGSSVGAYVAVDALMGASMACYLVLWGVLLCERDVAANECAFVQCFALVGLLLLGSCALPVTAVQGVLLILPLAEFVCYLLGSRSSSSSPVSGIAAGQKMEGIDATVAFAAVVARTGVAITIVSLVWGLFAAGTSGSDLRADVVFALGAMGSAAIIWMFTRYSPNVGFAASASWVLPVVAVGLAASVFKNAAALTSACFLLAAAHASFETILRLQVVRFAQVSAHDPVWTVGWGYVAIMAGAFVGDGIATLLVPKGGGVDAAVVACVLAGLVVIAVFLFPASKAIAEHPAAGLSAAGGSDVASDADIRSGRLAAICGLTLRETEVLARLLEGRSRPYIRDDLSISISTVDTHIRHIYAKTGVATRQELIDLSLR